MSEYIVLASQPSSFNLGGLEYMGTMDFKVNRETFTASRTVLDTSVEQSVERDFVLPDYCPDIFRILNCRIIPRITSQSINGGKASFEISVLIRALYQSEGSGKVNSLEQKLSYTKSVDISGECQNPMMSIIPHVDYINCRVVNQRRLDVRGAVSARIKITADKNQQIITDAFGANIQLKKSLMTYPAKRLTSSKRITVIEELELGGSKPPVGAVIRSDCAVFAQDKKIIAGKLITKGEAEISMLYSCAGGENGDALETMKFSIPFSQIIDIDGIDESFDAYVDISAAGCEIIPKGENPVSLECELVMLVNCTAIKFQTCEVVTDAYSTCYECESEKTDCRIDGVPHRISEDHSVRAELRYDEEEISCVYDAWCETAGVSARFDPDSGKYTVCGNVNFCVIGRNAAGYPIYLEKECPFEHEVSGVFSSDSAIDAKATVQSCSYRISGANAVEVSAELETGGCISEQSSGDLLCGLKVLTDKPKEKEKTFALKLCYCADNEDIWEIAKKYSTSIKAIMEENDLSDDNDQNCGMLLIPLTN